MDSERQQLVLKASNLTNSSGKASNVAAVTSQLDKSLVSQQRHALLPSDASRSNM
jgi:hypothetical protein